MVQVQIDDASVGIGRGVSNREIQWELLLFLMFLVTNQVQFELAVVDFLLLNDEVLPAVPTVGGVVARARVKGSVHRSIQLCDGAVRGAELFLERDKIHERVHIFGQDGQLLLVLREMY